jgi:ABC-type uncharacterized transport system involved in gliding motility auxiliary subunit
LWRAKRREKKIDERLRQHYHPLLEAAEKTKDQNQYQKVLGEFLDLRDVNDEAEHLETEMLVDRARKLGIPVPPRPNVYDERASENEFWEVNFRTGNCYLKEETELRLRREIRKEEVERLEHQMRWVSQVIIPIIGLIGALMGLISLVHSLRR